MRSRSKAGSLAAVALAVLAGVMGVADAAVDATETLEPGELARIGFNETTEETILSVAWNASAPVDVFVFSFDEFVNYTVDENWTPEGHTFAFVLDSKTGDFSRRIPPSKDLVVVLDNAPGPQGGAPGDMNVTYGLDVQLYTVFNGSGPGGLVRTATFQQPYWPIPGTGGLAISSQAILFLVLAGGAEAMAWREDPLRWRDVAIMVGLGAVFTAFVSSEGVILPDTRLLTIPAGLLALFALRRYRTRLAAAAGVFAAAFWGPFLGGDVLSSILHAGEIRALSQEGAVFVIGGAKWADALVIVPALATAFFAFRSIKNPVAGVDAKPAAKPIVEARATRTSSMEVTLRIANRSPKLLQRIRATLVPSDGRAAATFEVPRPLAPGEEQVVVLALSAKLVGSDALRGAVVASGGAHVRFEVVPPDLEEPAPPAPLIDPQPKGGYVDW